ncbi:nucleotide sugar dehydrogenase [Candidatus Woesearchaeota archaeon]|nr:nucleotide sugar dehydrogenase [Candidatus Woesearchaeota archaeon]
MKVAVIGTGYVGGVTGACFAKTGQTVFCYDVSVDKINEWNSANAEDSFPISEPGLGRIVLEHRNKNLFFTADPKTAISDADVIFICVNTPTKTNGIHEGSFEVHYVEQSARDIAPLLKNGAVVVGKSTVSVGTVDLLEDVLRDNIPAGVDFSVVSNPEFLAEGSAIEDFLNPGRVLIGIKDGDVHAKSVFDELYHFVPESSRIYTNRWTGEMSKLANNAMLSVGRLVLINSLTGLCEDTGADIVDVSRVLGMDARIGSKFLKPGIGYGGSCFTKDVKALIYLLKHNHRDVEAEFYESALKINYALRERFVEKMYNCLYSLKDKVVGVYGFTFKPETDDIRDAPAITVCKRLMDEGVFVKICDPKALKHIPIIFQGKAYEDGGNKRYSMTTDPYDAAIGANAIALITEWDVFKNLDFDRIRNNMKHPGWIFDGRNLYDSNLINSAGLNYYAIGRGTFKLDNHRNAGK